MKTKTTFKIVENYYDFFGKLLNQYQYYFDIEVENEDKYKAIADFIRSQDWDEMELLDWRLEEKENQVILKIAL